MLTPYQGTDLSYDIYHKQRPIRAKSHSLLCALATTRAAPLCADQCLRNWPGAFDCVQRVNGILPPG